MELEKKSKYWLNKSAMQGLKIACDTLCSDYVNKDINKAIYWYKKGTLDGWCQYDIGLIFWNIDKKKAICWFIKSMENNNIMSFDFILSIFYEKRYDREYLLKKITEFAKKGYKFSQYVLYKCGIKKRKYCPFPDTIK